jgi:hypothetical protein
MGEVSQDPTTALMPDIPRREGGTCTLSPRFLSLFQLETHRSPPRATPGDARPAVAPKASAAPGLAWPGLYEGASRLETVRTSHVHVSHDACRVHHLHIGCTALADPLLFVYYGDGSARHTVYTLEV